PEQDLALYGIDPVVPRLIGRAAGRRCSLLWGFGRCLSNLRRPFRRRFQERTQRLDEHARGKGKRARESGRSHAPAIAVASVLFMGVAPSRRAAAIRLRYFASIAFRELLCHYGA